jgi:fructose-1,6-bisphosphatase II / sedoheptulose-1,7-bisphosphatase
MTQEKKYEQILPLNVMQIANRATKAAAIACYPQIGRGNKHLADKYAVDAMRSALQKESDFCGTVVIGEGEMDEAPMLYIGEVIGSAANKLYDIAVDPLEGTTLCSKGQSNAISTIAIANKDTILKAPDIYMQKIASLSIKDNNIISLDYSLEENIINVAKYKNKKVSDVVVCLLDRQRHYDSIILAQSLGAKVNLITDGDVIPVLNENIDFYFGSGGAPEGVLTAAVLKAFGGFMQARMIFENQEQFDRAKDMGIKSRDEIYYLNDLVKSDVVFCATAITDGILNGVRVDKDYYITNSLITHSMGLIEKVTSYDKIDAFKF